MKDSFSERLREALDKKGMTQADLRLATGIGKSAISQYLSGRNEAKQDKIYKMAQALNVDPAWLMGYDVPERLPTNAVPVDTLSPIPIIGTIKAGNGGLAYEDPEGYEYMDVKDPDSHFFLRVTGDSMMPDIRPGELALIRKQTTIESGELAAVVVNGDEGTIKKVIKTSSAIVLQAFNPEYPPRIFAGEEMNDIHIAGKVVKTIRRW